MDKIYQCEDSIEQAKFQLARLHIEYAFNALHTVIKRKKLNYYLSFLYKLKVYSNRRLVTMIEAPFKKIEKAVESITQNKKRIALRHLQLHSQRQQRKNQENMKKSREREKPLKTSNDRVETQPSHIVKSVFIINEEDWKDKMTLQQLQSSCDYYSAKIKEVQKSFSDFFQVIKKE